jgi:hypothetical protein
MKKFAALAVLASLVLASGLRAESVARIDVVAPDKKTGMVFADASDGVLVSQAGWLGDVDKDKRLCATAKAGDEVKDFFFSFTPKDSGSLEITLMGEKGKDVAFKSIAVEGATPLVNGDFSKLDAEGMPESWRVMETPRVVDGFAIVEHNKRFVQTIKVEAGKPVKVFFAAKSAAASK